jgi:large conductance mechanosensitive channel
MLKEFKEFALKGNVIDMGVGIIIGAGFGKIVSSFVEDLLTPPLGLVLGKVNFTNLFLNLSGKHFSNLADAKAAGAATDNYGIFLNSILDFGLEAFALFLLITWAHRLRRQPVEPPPGNKECPECLSHVPLQARRCAFCTSPLPPSA